MTILKKHEEIVLDHLVADHFSPEVLNEIKNNGIDSNYETTENGYFFTIKHNKIPIERIVCDKPMLIGESNGIETGFVVFIENGEITIECHGWGDQDIPREYRNEKIKIRTT